MRYDHRRHAIADVAARPADDRLRQMFTLADAAELPQLLLVFVIDADELQRKYGARGMRFALQHVGHAAQNVSLRLTTDRNRGYVLGGGRDADVLDALGLGHTSARYGGAIACGR